MSNLHRKTTQAI